MDQKELRKKYSHIRNALKAEDISAWSELICQNVLKLLDDAWVKHSGLSARGIRSVLMYYPMNSEVSVLPLYDRLQEMDIHCYFPVTYRGQKDMIFFEPRGLNDFSEGNFHVMEPVSREHEYHGQAAAVIVPGLVFSSDGRRVGYGAGYYDRFFGKYPDALKIGVCFSCQITDEITVNPWDVKMDIVCTENNSFKTCFY